MKNKVDVRVTPNEVALFMDGVSDGVYLTVAEARYVADVLSVAAQSAESLASAVDETPHKA
jgi:hypothetical protein